MKRLGKSQLKKIGKTCLFYGEVVGFVAAWIIALVVVARQPAANKSVPPDQFAAASDVRETP